MSAPVKQARNRQGYGLSSKFSSIKAIATFDSELFDQVDTRKSSNVSDGPSVSLMA